MSAAPEFPTPMSVDEYLDFEASQKIRYEYVGGYLFAMVGGTLRHNLIVGNIYAALRESLAGSNCQAFALDVKVRTEPDVYYYPDVAVACDVDDVSTTFLEEPCLVIEVLSRSTQTRDRGEKLIAYRKVRSLTGYVIVHQDDPRVEFHHRLDDGTWQRDDVISQDATVVLPYLEIDLRLAEIYANLPES